YRHERTISAFLFVWRQTLEPIRDSLTPDLFTAVDMSGGLLCVAREPRARVERAVRANRVGVAPVNLAGPHMHAVRRGEAALARFVAQVCHLLVYEVARVADARPSRELAG